MKLQEALGRMESSQQLGKLVGLKTNPKLDVPSPFPSPAISLQQQPGPAMPAVAGTAFRKPTLLALGKRSQHRRATQLLPCQPQNGKSQQPDSPKLEVCSYNCFQVMLSKFFATKNN